MGPRAWLVDSSPEEVAALAAELRSRPVPGQTAVRTGAATVLVTVLAGTAERARVELATRTVAAADTDTEPGAVHLVDVVYDGNDRERLAQELGISVDAVLARHQDQEWSVAFCGFAPGFAYLRGWELEVPRLDTPRPAVPAGSVAVAGPFSAVYPTASPGGWQLLGRTDAPIWDIDRDPPALLTPGDRIRWRAVRPRVSGASDRRSGASSAPLPAPVPSGSNLSAPVAAMTILDPGLLTLIEDEGRPGLEHLGVCASGAADTRAARQANRLVGNSRSAAVLETLGGLRLRAQQDLVVAVSGAEVEATIEPGPAASPDGAGLSPVPARTPWAVATGQVLAIGHPRRGVRVYVAVRGGVEVAPVLGSRASDVLAGLGPPALRPGQVLELGRTTTPVGAPEQAPAVPGKTSTEVRFVVGPREQQFGPAGVRALVEQDWTVSATSNRVGLRLEGAPLRRLETGELPSEPMVPGAVQVPPSGLPVVLFRDHPVTGGYPVIGVVVPDDLDVLAQLAPGARIRLRAVDARDRPRISDLL